MSESRKSSKQNPPSQADLSNPGVDCAALGEFDNHAAMEAAFPIHLKKEMQCQHLMRPKPSCFVAERDVVGRKFLRGEIRKEGNAERITTFRCRTLLTSPKACRALGVATPSSSLLLLSNAAPGENHFKMEIVPSNQSTPSPESASRRRGEKLQLACRCVGGVTEPSIAAATARACRCVGSDLGPSTAAVQAKIMIPSGGIKTRIGSSNGQDADRHPIDRRAGSDMRVRCPYQWHGSERGFCRGVQIPASVSKITAPGRGGKAPRVLMPSPPRPLKLEICNG